MFGWIKRIDWFNRRALDDAQFRAEMYQKASQNWHRLALEATGELGRYERALDTIIAQETPGANATVKRMARIAKEARGK